MLIACVEFQESMTSISDNFQTISNKVDTHIFRGYKPRTPDSERGVKGVEKLEGK